MKVTLLGDSIRQQYSEGVKELLGADFDVWEPSENCRFAKYVLRGLFDWEGPMADSDIVHWNCGHWDVCRLFGDETFSSVEEYADNMLRIADILLKRYRKVIFATTTPVRTNNRFNSNADIDVFNAKLVPLLEKRGVIINDLNSPLRSDVDKYICDDTIHLTQDGIAVCAEKVAERIKAAAEGIAEKNVKADTSGEKTVGAPVLL